MKTDYVIVGNSLSCLILASLIKEKNVTLITNFNFLGGIFNGFKYNDVNFDFGMNYFEIFKNRNEPIINYDPSLRNDFLNYTKIINDFIDSKIQIKKVKKGKIFINGTIHNDYLIFNDLSFFNNLNDKEQLNILEDMPALSESRSHPKYKYESSLFYSKSYEQVCLELYGSHFYINYLEPFLLKVFNISGESIPAIFHRLAWLPLFFPESIKSSINSSPFIGENNFYYPKLESFSDFINSLKQEVLNNKRVEIIEGSISSLTKNNLEVKGNKFEFDKLFWGQKIYSLEELTSSKKVIISKTSLVMCFLNFKSKNLKNVFSVLNILDKSTPIYRITNQSANLKSSDTVKLSIEINKGFLNDNFPNSNVFQIIDDFLFKNNIISNRLNETEAKILNLDNAIDLPTFDNFRVFESLKLKYSHFNFLSPAESFYSNSINDQIVESHKISYKLNNELFR
jgi:hypothetical protein